MGRSTASLNASLLARQALSMDGWYWCQGVTVEQFSFSSGAGRPDRLRDVAAVMAVEYFEDDEVAAGITIRPGWYYGRHLTARAWDIPIEAFSGIPITRDFDGVIGVLNGRFYHHALPVAGVIWKASPRWRIEAVYPEPAVIFTPNKTHSLRLGGELRGGGFLVALPAGDRVVEYSSYRVGVTWTATWRAHTRFVFGAGTEVERSFDFFHEQSRTEDHRTGAFARMSFTWFR